MDNVAIVASYATIWSNVSYNPLLFAGTTDGEISWCAWCEHPHLLVSTLLMPPDKHEPHDYSTEADVFVGDIPTASRAAAGLKMPALRNPSTMLFID